MTRVNEMKAILLSCVASCALVAGAVAQEAPTASASGYALSAERCIADWLVTEKKQSGKNDLPDGSFLLIATGDAQVNADKKDSDRWLAARDAAFSQAELAARENIALYLKTEMKAGGRSFEASVNGGDVLPPVLDAAVKQLSASDKALTLTGAALDAEIKKYKPDWDGTGRSEVERHQEVVKVQSRMREQIEQYTRVLVSGAMTGAQCEGPNADGRYSVSTVAMWSFKLAQIAQSVTNPAYETVPSKAQLSLQDRFKQLGRDKPEWMALTQGVRVWTDENGKRVIVGFGSVPASSQASIDASRARTRALAAIQYFVAEQVESNNSENVDFSYRETTTGESTFNSSKYAQKISARTRAISIQGAETLPPWRLNHPWSNARMTTVAVRWSAESSRGAAAAAKLMEGAGSASAGGASSLQQPASSVRSGAAASTDDF